MLQQYYLSSCAVGAISLRLRCCWITWSCRVNVICHHSIQCQFVIHEKEQLIILEYILSLMVLYRNTFSCMHYRFHQDKIISPPIWRYDIIIWSIVTSWNKTSGLILMKISLNWISAKCLVRAQHKCEMYLRSNEGSHNSSSTHSLRLVFNV